MPSRVTLAALVLLLAGCASSSPVSTPITGDVEHGAQIFTRGQAGTPPCSACHRIISGQVGFSLGPNLAGITERAGTRVASLTAEEYLRQSIIEPGSYMVSGYRDIMYPSYKALLTEQDIRDLIAYLLTLE